MTTQITDGRHLELINDGMGFRLRELPMMNHPAVAAINREMQAKRFKLT